MKPKTNISSFHPKNVAGLNPFYLLAGDEPFLIQDALHQIKQLTRASSYDWQRFDSENTFDWSSQLPEILSPDMFSATRVIHLVMTHQDFKGSKAIFESLFKNPIENQMVLIEITNYDKKERNTLQLAFVKNTLAPAQAVISALTLYDSPPPWKKNAPPWESELGQWVKNRASTVHRIKIPPSELMQLIDICGNDLGRLAGEIDKLALLTHPKKTVPADLLHDLTSESSNLSLEAFSRALQKLDAPTLLKILSQADTAGIYSKGKILKRPEEQFPLFIHLIESAIRSFMKVHRFRQHHSQPSTNDLEKLEDTLELSRIRSRYMKEKILDTLMQSTRRIRKETLIKWQGLIHKYRRLSRSGKYSKHLIFQLIAEMFHTRFILLDQAAQAKMNKAS